MNGPIHSKGVGRSGPKRKTGCLTCRRRKVRCDEGRPVCANCIRLRLDCEFVPLKSKSSRTSPSTTSSAGNSAHRTSSFSHANTQQSSTIHSSAQPADCIPITTYDASTYHWTTEAATASSFSAPYPDNFLPSLESFDLGLGFPGPTETYLPSSSYADTVHTTSANVHSNFNFYPSHETPVSDHDRCQKLLSHFVQSVDPTKLFQPTQTEWASICRSLLAMANDCLYLLSAICALSALHLCCTTGEDSFQESLRHYRLASRQINKILDNDMSNDRELKQAFAAAFLCIYAELMAQTLEDRQQMPLQHLQGFHHRVRQHNDRIQSWTGLSKRLIAWSTLLQTKAEWNSGDVALQQSSAALAQYTSARDRHLNGSGTDRSEVFNTGSASGSEENFRVAQNEVEARSVTELAYDTFNQPSYDFFLKSQAFTSRIVGLEYYSQEHGSVQMNLETLKDGQRINADLHALWASRPSTIHLLRDPRSLEDVLQPHFARRILLHVRVYTANFFAQFIHLHRVAFEAFPATADVEDAVARIISLTKAILHEVPERRRSQTHSPSTSSTHDARNHASGAENSQLSQSPVALPTMMLWPLFLACTECDTANRLWILDVLRSMVQPTCPSIARMVYLLEELLRRQDQEGRRIDHREIRREVFDGELSTIY